MFILKRRKVRLLGVAFSPNGSRIATVGDRGTVLVWDLATREVVADVSFSGTRYAVTFLDEDRLVVAGHLLLHTRDLSDAADWVAFPLSARTVITRPIVSPDRTAVALVDGSLTRHTLADPPVLVWENAQAHVGVIAWSPCSRFLIGAGRSKTPILFDAGTGVPVRTFGEPAKTWVTKVAVAPGGHTAAWAASSTLYLQKAGGAIVRHRFGRAHFNALAFHPTATLLATANGDGKVDYWDVDSGERRTSFEWSAVTLNGVAFDATGDRAACCSSHGEVIVWDVDC